MARRRIGPSARRLVALVAGALLGLHCALPGFTIVEDDGDGATGGLGGDEGAGGASLGGASSGGAVSGGTGSGGADTGGTGGAAGADAGGTDSGGTGSGGTGSGGTGTGGAGPCGDLEQACCESGSGGGCNAPYECSEDTCEDLRLWQVQQKLTAALPSGAADGATDAYFGGSVDVSGDTAVVGSSGDDDQGNRSGSAYVLVRSGSTWTVQQKLTAALPAGGADGAAVDLFGYSVAISGDTAVIGSMWDDDEGTDSGSAYVFVRSGSTWTVQQKLTATLPDGTTDGAAGDNFGRAVAVSGDTAVIGSYLDADEGTDSGSAYVFVRSGSTWTVQQKLTATLPDGTADGAAGHLFGFSVAVSGDTAVIGSRFDDDQGTASGSAYVFVRAGSTWTVEQKLTATLPDGTADGAASDYFGYSVAVSGDTAVIGSYGDDDQGTDSGSAYVFARSGSTWAVEQKLTPGLPGAAADGAAGDLFGYSVAVSGDAAVVGSRDDDDEGADSGSAYVYARSGSSWTMQQKLTAALPGGAADGAPDDGFGSRVAISGDTAAIGSSLDDVQSANSGSAYVFVFE